MKDFYDFHPEVLDAETHQQQAQQTQDRERMDQDVRDLLGGLEGINNERAKVLNHKWLSPPIGQLKALNDQEAIYQARLRKALNYLIKV